MMNKLLCLLLAFAACTACNDDDNDTIRFATENDGIENGYLQGINLQFYGTSTVTDRNDQPFTDDEAWFEFAGGPESFTLYMHKTRFAAGMPGVEMRLRTVPYAPTGDKSLAFAVAELVPEALRANETGGGSSYQPVERYRITDLEGRIDGVTCRVAFTCAGIYRVVYEGRLIRK